MNVEILQKLIYSNSTSEKISFLSSCNDPESLHVFAFNYNWSNGFEIPQTIIDNPACTLGTALMIFYLGDGYRYLMEKNEFSDIPEWLNFISELYNRILTNCFTDKSISFSAPVSKVQLFKLKKQLDENEAVFISPVIGKNLDITL